MKISNYLTKGVFVVAVAMAFASCGSHEKGEDKGTFAGGDSICTRLPVAYVNVDSLLQSYSYSKDMTEEFLRKAESSRANLNQKASSFQAEYLEFQKKVENNAFLTRERMEQEGNRLARKQQSLQQESEKMQMDLAREQQRINEQLRDTITSNLKLYNNDKKYQMILTSEVVLYGEDYYDITQEVIDFLNAKYKPAAEKSDK